MTKPNVIYESFETWKGGSANGYYEPKTNEIHILKGKDMELRCLWHESAHASRQHKLTFRIAKLLQTPLYRNVFFACLVVLGLLSVFAVKSAFPIVFSAYIATALFYLSTYFCAGYEEFQANLEAKRLTKHIKGEYRND